jgi:hypothetical protein
MAELDMQVRRQLFKPSQEEWDDDAVNRAVLL